MERKKINLVIVSILVLAVICLGSYVVYDKFITNGNVEVNDDNNNSTNETLTPTSKLAKDLYSLIDFGIIDDKITNSSYSLFHQNKLLNNNTLSNLELLSVTYSKLTNDDYDLKSFPIYDNLETGSRCKITDNIYVYANGEAPEFYNEKTLEEYSEEDYCITQQITKNDFINRYKKIFGKDAKNLNFETITIMNNGHSGETSCTYYNFSFYCYFFPGGGTGFPSEYTTIESVNRVGDSIIIIDRYLATKVSFVDDELIRQCYSNLNDKSPILNCKIDDENSINSSLSKHGAKYKHTFKPNADGTYYWYSSEPINK